MAHNLEFNAKSGTTSFFYVKNELPWHRLGQGVPNALTTKEAIIEANLGFTVVKEQNFVRYGNKEFISPDSFSTIRTDVPAVLGAVGKDYTIVQNIDAFSFFDVIVGENQAIFQTAGVLGNGERIFITAKLPKSIVLDNVDQIDQYLLLSNSHDGSRSIEVLFTPIRVVCNNTLQAALSTAKNRIKIRHTISAHDKLKEAHKLMGIHTELLHEQEDYFNILREKQIDINQFQTYVCNVFMTPSELQALAMAGLKNINKVKEISTRKLNILNEVANYYEFGPGQSLVTAKDTLWGAYNAITGYYQNGKDFKNDLQKKVNTNFYGTNYLTMSNAYNVAVSMANNKIPILSN